MIMRLVSENAALANEQQIDKVRRKRDTSLKAKWASQSSSTFSSYCRRRQRRRRRRRCDDDSM